MIRARKLLTVVVPSLIAGGLLFGSTFGNADVTVTRDGKTIVIPTPPAPPAPPNAPPPAPGADPWGPSSGGHGRHRHGMSISIKDNKIQLDGVKDMVADQITAARKQIESANLPPDIRARVLARLDRAAATVDRHLAKLDRMKSLDMDQLGEELGSMGEELGSAMDGLSEDLSNLNDRISKDVQKQIARSQKQIEKQLKNMPKVVVSDEDGNNSDDDNSANDNNDGNDDNDNSAAATPSIDKDDDHDRAAMAKLGDLQLEPQQRSMIAQIRRDTDRRVADAKREIDQLSDTLKTALDNPATNEAEVNHYVDQITQQEAVIRKARLNAWMSARRILRDDQRVKVVHAASKKSP